MDAWAASYGSNAAFVCVSCAGPQLATQFGMQLKLRHCHNTWVDQDEMPTWGQLGCNGLIVLDGAHSVVCRASPAYLEVRDAAFRHVETLLDALIGSKAAPQTLSGKVDPAGCVEGGAVCSTCAEVRFGDEAEDDAQDGARKRQATTSGSVNKVPSVKVEVLDAEHERCEAALMRLAEQRDVAALSELLSAYEQHFAHEEALLDEHLYAGVMDADGFSADKGARTSHFGDHENMLVEIRKMISSVSPSDAVPAAEVKRLALDFERHATAYDGSYADRLSAAMAAKAQTVIVA